MEAARVLVHDLLGVVRVAPVDEGLHRAALTATLASGRREVSLVDWTSFLYMRQREIQMAFAYDNLFWEQGFKPVQAEDHG
jgi:predicted nucleic acid-binding protein